MVPGANRNKPMRTGNSFGFRAVSTHGAARPRKPNDHLIPNVIALDKYLITFHCDGGVCPNLMDASGIAYQRPSVDDKLLMRSDTLLGQAIAVTRCRAAY